jgi:hypothetical protein
MLRVAMGALLIAMIGLWFFWHSQDPTSLPTVTIAPIQVTAPPERCEITYGPIGTPRDGWAAWGYICPEGKMPDGIRVRRMVGWPPPSENTAIPEESGDSWIGEKEEGYGGRH